MLVSIGCAWRRAETQRHFIAALTLLSGRPVSSLMIRSRASDCALRLSNRRISSEAEG